MTVKCPACGLFLATQHNLRRHEKTYHNKGQSQSSVEIKFNITCSVCGDRKSSRDNFLEHLRTAHDFTLQQETKRFESFDEFLEWKIAFEAADQNKFVLTRGNGTIPSPLTKRKTISYTCHRSGYYIPEGKGIRRLKVSKKINGCCPAQIKLIAHEGGLCVATIFYPHWGHSHNGDELSHFHLNAPEEDSLQSRKDRVISTLLALEVQVRSFNTVEEVEAVAKSLQHVQSAIAAVQASREQCQKYPFVEADQSNKRKKDPQPQFFSSKNKKKKNNDYSLANPKQEEKDRDVYSLCQPTIPFTNVTNH